LLSGVRLSISSVFGEIYTINEIPVFKTFPSGRWFLSGETFDVKTPIDGSLIARVSKPDWSLVEDSLSMVREVGRWRVRELPGDERGSALCGHCLIFVPLHSARVFIGLGGFRGHPGDPTS